MEFEYNNFHWRKLVWKCRRHSGGKITNPVQSPNSLYQDYAVQKTMITRVYFVRQLLLAKCVGRYTRHVHFALLIKHILQYRIYLQKGPRVDID